MKNYDWGIKAYADFIYTIGLGIFTGIIAGISISSGNEQNIHINWGLLITGLLLILLKKWVEEKSIFAIFVSLISLLYITFSLFDYI